MKIGVIGSGNVGGTLGKRWAQKGHSVMFGVRDASDPKLVALLKQAGPNARSGSVPEAANFGKVVVFAIPWQAMQDAVRAAGNLSGKIVIDCANPLKADYSGLDVGLTTSGGEQVATWARGARVVKIFNTTGANNMEDPAYPPGPTTMFYCGDDAHAKKAAAQLAGDLGFEPVDAGELAIARLLEPFAMLWIHLALRQGMGRDFAFNLVRR